MLDRRDLGTILRVVLDRPGFGRREPATFVAQHRRKRCSDDLVGTLAPTGRGRTTSARPPQVLLSGRSSTVRS